MSQSDRQRRLDLINRLSFQWQPSPLSEREVLHEIDDLFDAHTGLPAHTDVLPAR